MLYSLDTFHFMETLAARLGRVILWLVSSSTKQEFLNWVVYMSCLKMIERVVDSQKLRLNSCKTR